MVKDFCAIIISIPITFGIDPQKLIDYALNIIAVVLTRLIIEYINKKLKKKKDDTK